jgi:hypothetical protein
MKYLLWTREDSNIVYLLKRKFLPVFDTRSWNLIQLADTTPLIKRKGWLGRLFLPYLDKSTTFHKDPVLIRFFCCNVTDK